MARNKNKFSGLVNQLTSSNVDGMSISKSLKPLMPGGSSPDTTGSVGKPPSLHDSQALSIATKSAVTGIQFGRPSNTRTSSSQSASAWTGLLKQSTSGGGLASVLSGGLSSLGGIGGLFSGILKLFGGGGKSTPPALVQFQLPNSISQTMYVSSNGGTRNQGNSVEAASTSAASATNAASTQQLQYQSAAIAQAVKTALLNSSSLNDVIAEI